MAKSETLFKKGLLKYCLQQSIFKRIISNYKTFLQEHVLSYFLRYRLSSCLDLASAGSGQTLLHTCAWFGTLAPMNLLLEHGCDPSKPNNREQAPLHLAALQGHRACVAGLLKAGADPMSGDLANNSPLHMAVIGSHFDCVRELLNNDEVDVNFQNSEGKTSFCFNVF